MYPDKDHLVAHFFLQLLVILATARGVGWIGRRWFGQTQVVGEMLGGILLGPSLFALMNARWLAEHLPGGWGRFAEAVAAAQQWLFPTVLLGADGAPVMAHGAKVMHPSMSILYAVAQLGLTLYMFVIGMEFDAKALAAQRRSAGLVAGAGMVLPLILGGGAAFLLAGHAPLFGPGVGRWGGALYLGAAMCITAFPTLARILDERGMTRTRLGTLSLAAGAANDALAWCLLAIVLSITAGSPAIAVTAIGGGIAYVALTLTLGRRLLAPLDGWVRAKGVTPALMAVVLLCLAAAAGVTEAIKLYAVFGAFILGAAMPRGELTEKLTGKLEPLVSTLLLPVFFAYSGLNTEIQSIQSPWLWAVALLLLAAAIAGKGLGCLLAARAGGESWRDALGAGVLMNARGLMELIILNIGLQKGLITRELFAMMVVMALVTTLMTSPLLHVLYPKTKHSAGTAPGVE